MMPPIKQPEIYQKEISSVGDENTLRISLWTKIVVSVRTHQNLISFILLVICLAVGLLWWQHYRVQTMTLKAFYAMEKTKDPEELKGLIRIYSATPAAPFIRYKLANLYMDADKYEDARKEYIFIIEKFPSHPAKEWASIRLEQLKINETWTQNDLNKQLSELIQKRNLPRLTIKTNKGDFEVELYEDEAPNTVANFINFVRDSVYSPTAVCEINPDLGICLDKSPTPISGGSASGGISSYYIPFEINALKHQEGVLGMFRDIDPKTIEEKPEQQKYLPSSGSKFYIYTNSSENETIDGKYTIFGKVVKGISIVKQLVKGDTINSIIINFKRSHEYKTDQINIEKQSSPTIPNGTSLIEEVPQGAITPSPIAPSVPTKESSEPPKK